MNGYGEHNIQGIGDKHVPLIHNVMNTDLVIGVSDQATDGLNAVFNTDDGPRLSRRARLGADAGSWRACSPISACPRSPTSSAPSRWPSTCALGPDDVIVTVATDGARDVRERAARAICKRRHNRATLTDEVAAEIVGAAPGRRRHRARAGRHRARARAHLQPRLLHLGRAAGHRARRFRPPPQSQDFWRGLHALVPQWDEMITAFNRDSGMAAAA